MHMVCIITISVVIMSACVLCQNGPWSEWNAANYKCSIKIKLFAGLNWNIYVQCTSTQISRRLVCIAFTIATRKTLWPFLLLLLKQYMPAVSKCRIFHLEWEKCFIHLVNIQLHVDIHVWCVCVQQQNCAYSVRSNDEKTHILSFASCCLFPLIYACVSCLCQE